MSELVQAVHKGVAIGSVEIDFFRLPDGSYRISQKQVAECIGLPELTLQRFLQQQSNSGNYYQFLSVVIFSDSLSDMSWSGPRQLSSVSLDMAMMYWLKQSKRGNEQARQIINYFSRVRQADSVWSSFIATGFVFGPTSNHSLSNELYKSFLRAFTQFSEEESGPSILPPPRQNPSNLSSKDEFISDDDFEQAIDYVLKKNQELYERLA